jgi:DNA-binding NtrC family response regulator
VVVDAAGPDEQRPSTWHEPETSPLCLADGGTLFIASVSALALETQAFLAESLANRRSPAGHDAPLDLQLVVSVPTTVDSLVASGHLDPELADCLGDRAVPLPPLSARSDDLRALFLDRLARIGMRLKGRPIGLDPRALGRLVEHAWPGNELELDDVLTRAVAIVDGEVLTSAHLDQIGFVAAPPPARRSLRSPPPGQQPLGS